VTPPTHLPDPADPPPLPPTSAPDPVAVARVDLLYRLDALHAQLDDVVTDARALGWELAASAPTARYVLAALRADLEEGP
jgi:hypothetical protein